MEPLAQAHTIPQIVAPTRFEKLSKQLKIIFCEALAVLLYAIPYNIKWLWQRHVVKTIEVEPFSDAFFNTHGKVDQTAMSVLLCHGDFGHPFTMLHLVELAQSKKVNVFSLYIPGSDNNKNFNHNADVVGYSIEKIKNMAPQKIIAAGHSKGAILLAHRHFVKLDPNLDHICTIAGRLRIPQGSTDPRDQVDDRLKGILVPITAGIESHPERELTQIVPKEDWNASQEGMCLRPETSHSVPGMHYSGLYAKETEAAFEKILVDKLA